MDLGNGRSERVEDPISTPPPLLFTLPFSGEEILLLSDQGAVGLGLIYHPRKTAAAIPWKSTCPHCLQGRQSGVDINVKRAVKVLCSRKLVDDVEEYCIPTNNNPCTIWCKRSDTGLIVKIHQQNQEPIDAIWQGNKFVTQGKSPLLESKIVGRTLKFLGSVQTISKREAHASLMPLLKKQRLNGIDTHRRHLCLKIDWASLLTS